MGQPALLTLRESWCGRKREGDGLNKSFSEADVLFSGGRVPYLSESTVWYKHTLTCTNIPDPREPHPKQLFPYITLKEERKSQKDLRERMRWRHDKLCT